MNKYTRMIHNKGWSVVDALKRWHVSRDSYDRWRKSDIYNDRLLDLIDGLDSKEIDDV